MHDETNETHTCSIAPNEEERLKYPNCLLLSSHFSFLLPLSLNLLNLLTLSKTTLSLLLLLLLFCHHLLWNCLPLLFISICLQILLRDWLLFHHFFLCVVEGVVVVVVVVSFL